MRDAKKFDWEICVCVCVCVCIITWLSHLFRM